MTRIFFLVLFFVAAPVLAREAPPVFGTGQVQVFDRAGLNKATFAVEVRFKLLMTRSFMLSARRASMW